MLLTHVISVRARLQIERIPITRENCIIYTRLIMKFNGYQPCIFRYGGRVVTFRIDFWTAIPRLAIFVACRNIIKGKTSFLEGIN